MRLTVTPIGASGSSSTAIAKAVVNYLEGEQSRVGARGVLGVAVSSRSADYYSDSIEGAGRWLGSGATFRGLVGTVDREDFQRVLEGRHPVTGERLLTSQGSANRHHLSVGSHARLDDHGVPLYEVGDAARLLGMRLKEVMELVEAGRRSGRGAEDDVSWLGSVDDEAGGFLIPDVEISRHLELATTRPEGSAVRATGSADDLLTVSEAAVLLKVTPSYVRRLCASGARVADARPAAWLPSVRANDNGHFRVLRSDVADFAERRRPPIARVGFDLTLTVEKSVGVLAALSVGPRQDTFVEALHAANAAAMRYMDQYASVSRRRGAVVTTEGLMVAAYFHGTSRALDPHPHHHNVVANAVVDDDGGIRTLDARALYRHAPAAAALATATLRWELRDEGLAWRRRSDGVWEIDGVSDDVVREFSHRRLEMDEVRNALEDRLGRRISHHAEDTVALSTRSAKQAVDPIVLRDDWLSRADRVGLDIEACFDRPDRALAFETLPDDVRHDLFTDLVDPIDGLCAGTNTFDRGDVMRMIADWSIVDATGTRTKVLVPPGEVERLTARFCATDLVVEMENTSGVIRRRDGVVVHDGQHDPTFTTIELLDVQDRIVSAVHDGVGSGVALVDAETIDAAAAAASPPQLSVEQVALVRSWLSSGDRVQCAVGRAGTGKTTTMRVAARAWEAAGFRVLGASVKGEAARLVGSDAGIDAETVAMLLARAASGVRVLDARTVLIVDEASTIGDRDLLALCDLAIASGAALRLIGDTARHGSVPAGGSFAELVRQQAERTPQLTTVRRLVDEGERRRAELVRDGSIDAALGELEASGQLVLTASDADTHAAMVTRWYSERAAGRSHPMVHGRNQQRRVLNTLAQQLLIDDGDVDPTRGVELSDGRRLCVGDVVVARHGDRSIHPPGNRDGWMRNGATGHIIDVRASGRGSGDDEIDVATTEGVITCRRVTFDRRDTGIDLAYAVTSYAVQGATNDVSTSTIGPSTSRSELYVDITRGRHSNQLYGTRAIGHEGDTEQHLPRLESELIPVLQSRLARSDPRTALSADPTAMAANRAAHGRTLAGLIAARTRGDNSATLAGAIRRSEAAVRRVAEHEPPAGIDMVLPARPSCPHLAARWNATVGDVAVFLAVENPRIRPDQVGLAGLIGSRTDATDPARWDDCADLVRGTAVDIVCRQLAEHYERHDAPHDTAIVKQRPDWLTHYLTRRVDAGTLTGLDLGRLADVVRDVHAWRIEHYLDTATKPEHPLGPTPDNAHQRAQHTQLQRRLTGPTRATQGRHIG